MRGKNVPSRGKSKGKVSEAGAYLSCSKYSRKAIVTKVQNGGGGDENPDCGGSWGQSTVIFLAFTASKSLVPE